ncbi:MAG: hypothetical protein NTX72_04025 [Candidatus Uhrbacteria bacterium]|nr:hypothetical protein [Candidatus Uhrbacteria bacterium]
MKKFGITLESLDQKIDNKIDVLDLKIDKLEKKIDSKIDILDKKIDRKIDILDRKIDSKIDILDKKIDAKFDAFLGKLDQRFNALEEKIEDNTSSIQFLIEHAVMREELRPIIREEIDARLIPMESRLLLAIDAMMGKHRTFEEEVLAGRYRQDQFDFRLGAVEQRIGLTNAV